MKDESEHCVRIHPSSFILSVWAQPTAHRSCRPANPLHCPATSHLPARAPPMLIGYVSDERYVALPEVLLEFTDAKGGSWEARSRASGAVHLDAPAGDYTVTLQKPGFGAKRVRLTLPQPQPYHFRLLSDGLLGYTWP